MAKGKNYKDNRSQKNRSYDPKPSNRVVDNPLTKGKGATVTSAFREGHNDWQWYARSEQMLQDSANLAMNQLTGAQYTLHKEQKRIPGVCSLVWTPIPGIATQGSDAVNIAARNIYSVLRSANSGQPQYQPSDYMMYLLAVDSLASFHAALVRAYGCMNYWNPINKYTGKMLVEALGFDYDNLVRNKAQFIYTINQFARRINHQLLIPNGIPYLARHVWMNTHVYMDRFSTHAQFYAYRMSGVLLFSEMEGAERPYSNLDLEILNPVNHLLTLEEIEASCDALLNPLINSGSIATMVGDTRKAFGDGGSVSLPEINDSYQVVPQYDEAVLHQMHNFTPVGAIYETEALVTQDVENNLILCSPKVSIGDTSASHEMYFNSTNPDDGTFYNNPYIFDLHMDSPTAKDIMVSSRMMAAVKDPSGDGLATFATLSICGTEVPNSIFVYTMDSRGDSLDRVRVPMYSFIPAGVTSTQAHDEVIFENVVALQRLSTFDMAPTVYACNVLVSLNEGWGTDQLTIEPIGDLDNYITISNDVLSRMHDCAILSLMDIPNLR